MGHGGDGSRRSGTAACAAGRQAGSGYLSLRPYLDDGPDWVVHVAHDAVIAARDLHRRLMTIAPHHHRPSSSAGARRASFCGCLADLVALDLAEPVELLDRVSLLHEPLHHLHLRDALPDV